MDSADRTTISSSVSLSFSRMIILLSFYFFRLLSFLFACISHSVSSRQVYGSLTLLACSHLLSSFLSLACCCTALLHPSLFLVPLSCSCKSPVKIVSTCREKNRLSSSSSLTVFHPPLLLPALSCHSICFQLCQLAS